MPDIVTFEAFKERLKSSSSTKGVQAGSHDMLVRQGFAADIRAIDDAARTVDWVISTDSVDRSSDSVKVEGWRLDNYRKNPVVLFAHDSDSLPVAQATKVGIEGNTLRSTSLFADAETYAFADTVYKLVRGKFLRAVSVGFIPLKYQWVDDDPKRIFGMDILEQELLEYSIVPIPCNPEALIAAGMKGIDLTPIRQWAEKILDTGETVVVPRAVLERAFKLAKTPKSERQKYLREQPAPLAQPDTLALSIGIDMAPIAEQMSAMAKAFDGFAASLRSQSQGDPALGNDDDGDQLEAAASPGTMKDGDEPDEEPGSIDQVTAGKDGATAPDGKPADNTDRDGDTGGENQDVSNAAAQPGKEAGAAAPAKKDMGYCGMAADAECGMKDPAQCSIHAPTQKDAAGPTGADTMPNPGLTDPPKGNEGGDGAANTIGGPSGAQTDPSPGVSEDETSSAHPGNADPTPGDTGGPMKGSNGDGTPAGGAGSGKPDPDADDPDTAVSQAAMSEPKTYRIVISDETAKKFGAAEKEAPAAEPPATGGIKVDPEAIAKAVTAAVATGLAKAMGRVSA